jgi:hypothetical protein
MSKEITKIVSDVISNLMDTQDHLKALSLITKYQLKYLDEESVYLTDIEKNAVKYKENNEIMIRFLSNSLDNLHIDLSAQNQTLLDL